MNNTRRSFYIPETASIECPNCYTAMDCAVERDEDGGHAELDTTPCSEDHCTRKLCPNCPQFECVCCGLPHCISHVVVIGGKQYCRIGAQEYLANAAVSPDTDVEITESRVVAVLARYVRGEISGVEAVN